MNSAKHPVADFSVYFDESAHQYYIDTEKNTEYWEKVPSVTQFVGHYTPPFDTDKIAALSARKQGKTADAVKAEWEAKKNAACEMGTRVHLNQEKHIKGLTDYTPPKDESYKLAGTIDALFMKGRVLYIVDWKTNETIKSGNEYHQYMLPPAETLEDCALNHYSLQLNLYERILRKEHYIPQIQEVKKMLIHLRPNEYKIIPIADNPVADKLLLDYMAGNWYELTPF